MIKKSELIQKLQQLPGDPIVKIFDWKKNLSEDSGDGSYSGIYDFEISLENLTEDEKEYYKEKHQKNFIPWIKLSFESDDYTDEGIKYD